MCIHVNRTVVRVCIFSYFMTFLLEDAVLKDMKCAKMMTFKGKHIPFFFVLPFFFLNSSHSGLHS